MNLTNVAKIAIGFGDGIEGIGPDGGDGVVYFDDVRLYSARCRLSERSAAFARADYAPDPCGDCVIDYRELEIMAGDWLAADYDSDPLIAWYKLNGNANDSSAYNNDGTAYGDPNWGTAGKIGTAIDLNGVGDYVDCSNDVSLDITDAITLAAWVKTDDANNGRNHVYVAKGNNSYAIKHRINNVIEFFIYDGGWYSTYYDVDGSFNGVWRHLAGTYDGSQLKLYVDGVLQPLNLYVNNALQDTTVYRGSIATNTFNVNIGRNSQSAGSTNRMPLLITMVS